MPSNHLFEPGDVFNVYSIEEPFEGWERPIQCFLARDTRSNRQVKLHCLDRRPRENTPEQIERFHSTLARLRALDHITLAATYDGGITDRVYWAATEHAIDGITLGSLIGDPERRLSVSFCILFTNQLANALRSARDAGVLHLRLDPDRILVHPSLLGVDKLLETGLAELFSLSPGIMRSDPLYRAPEQLRDKGRAPDERTDIYALGMILYTMLAWDLPFADADNDGQLPGTDKLLFLAMTQTPPLLRERNAAVPEFLDVFLQSVIAKSRANRPPSLEALGSQLNELFERHNVWCGAMNSVSKLGPAKARALITAMRETGDTGGKRLKKPRSGERLTAALQAGIEGYHADEADETSEPEWIAALPPEPEENDQRAQGRAESPEVPAATAAPEASITEEPVQDPIADPAPAEPPPASAPDRISPERVTLPSIHLAPPVPEAARRSRLSWAPVAAAATGVLALAALAVFRSGAFQSPEVRFAEPFGVVLPPPEDLPAQKLEAPPQPEPSRALATPSVRLEPEPRLAPRAAARPPVTKPAKSSAKKDDVCKTFVCLEDGGVKPAQKEKEKR